MILQINLPEELEEEEIALLKKLKDFRKTKQRVCELKKKKQQGSKFLHLLTRKIPSNIPKIQKIEAKRGEDRKFKRTKCHSEEKKTSPLKFKAYDLPDPAGSSQREPKKLKERKNSNGWTDEEEVDENEGNGREMVMYDDMDLFS